MTPERVSKARLYSICVHEAGHAVTFIRVGDTVKCVWVKGDSKARRSAPTLGTETVSGLTGDGACKFESSFSPVTGGGPLGLVAGSFAELRWGGSNDRTTVANGARGDFLLLVRVCRQWAVDVPLGRGSGLIKTALEIWESKVKELSRLDRADPSFEKQVKAVARVLVKKRRLTGDEVKAIMAKVKP